MTNDDTNGKSTVKPEEALEPVPPEEAGADEAIVDDLASHLEAITVERDRLASEKEELEKQTIRQRADYENLRKRGDKERAEIAEYASGEVVRAMLTILDDFERALDAVPEELGSESEYVKGVQMIYQRLSEELKKLGLEAIESVGQPFDPNVHHAIERVPAEDVEDDTVLEEWQKGYNFRGKLLREAMVRVAVKPS